MRTELNNSGQEKNLAKESWRLQIYEKCSSLKEGTAFVRVEINVFNSAPQASTR